MKIKLMQFVFMSIIVVYVYSIVERLNVYTYYLYLNVLSTTWKSLICKTLKFVLINFKQASKRSLNTRHPPPPLPSLNSSQLLGWTGHTSYIRAQTYSIQTHRNNLKSIFRPFIQHFYHMFKETTGPHML